MPCCCFLRLKSIYFPCRLIGFIFSRAQDQFSDALPSSHPALLVNALVRDQSPTPNFIMCKKAACDSCSTSPSPFPLSIIPPGLHHEGLLTLVQTRPPGGAAASTSPASCPTFPPSNGAHADLGSNKKATSTRRWVR
jgi:hypothetical protein